MKMEKKMPTLNNFLYLVKLNYKIDKYNAVKNQLNQPVRKSGANIRNCCQWYRSSMRYLLFQFASRYYIVHACLAFTTRG